MLNTFVSSTSLVSEEYPEGISKNSKILIVSYPVKYKKDSIKIRDENIKKRVESITLLNEKDRAAASIDPEEKVPTDWDKYESECLIGNKHFIAYHETETEFLYTFDLSKYSDAWDSFLVGSYSSFEDSTKTKILEYKYNDHTAEARKKMFCYMFPYKFECLVDFARELGVSVADLREIGELCDKPNLKLEDYFCELCPSKRD